MKKQMYAGQSTLTDFDPFYLLIIMVFVKLLTKYRVGRNIQHGIAAFQILK